MNSCEELEPFALQVLGNSMEPEFPDRCIVIIDPANNCQSGDYVMAEYDGETWFRQYIKEEDGEECLHPLNEHYPPIYLVKPYKILGVIVQRNIRRQVKHY